MNHACGVRWLLPLLASARVSEAQAAAARTSEQPGPPMLHFENPTADSGSLVSDEVCGARLFAVHGYPADACAQVVALVRIDASSSTGAYMMALEIAGPRNRIGQTGRDQRCAHSRALLQASSSPTSHTTALPLSYADSTDASKAAKP